MPPSQTTADNNHADSQSPPPKPTPIVLSLFVKPIIMLFFLSLFLFLGIAAVTLLFLLLAGSSLHLFRRRRSTSTTTSISSVELEKLLPGFNFDPKIESAKDCVVCLESFNAGELCRRLSDCNHVFHVRCVDSWLTKVLNCPICRAPVYSDSVGSGSLSGEDDDFKLWWPVGV